MPSKGELRLQRLLAEHERWRSRESLNLLASENLSSPSVQRYLSSDMGRRYTLELDQVLHGEKVDNGYAGTRYLDEVEGMARSLAAKLLHGKRASVKPLSGHVAALCVLAPLLPRGARYLAVFPEQGGYDGYAPAYIPSVLGYTARELPVHGPLHEVDVEEVTTKIRREKPEAVILGQSYFVLPYPVRPIADAVHEHGGKLLYDASHVMGLVMGGEFQDPLGEGADVVYGSTHKSFFGPQGGIIAARDIELLDRIEAYMTWRILDNAHWNRIAALTQALLEMERYGRAYASTVVVNARALASELEAQGIPVLGADLGYTRSHQVFLDGATLKARHGLAPPGLARRLERQDILIDLVGRVGTAEATRLGVRKTDMPEIARWIHSAGILGKPVKAQVNAFRRRFKRLRFA
jgi:glycine hydroxymethyltransferase